PRGLIRVLPRSQMWRLMRPFTNRVGMRLVNAVKYAVDRRSHNSPDPAPWPLAAYSFLLDAIPEWQRSYGRGGLIQYQAFVPASQARRVLAALLDLPRYRGIPPFLAVMKRHREDPFLIR